ncbi:hypothetical protein HOE37_03345 [Candidatus Woesearchaeota archaeon]|jgi:hypothetical protein|nr:hypothetical protein [Candidatus Woesearchaeota archaeon]MBT4110865.1 hypothetical protein [Candidatus Woesearchaeota archaeon]MBT4336623.1 hypothetical protein [Candidatus Woesearchaeota archaeon]MBT4469628.1 hypothetical protein [Candidatus Woesearchaeota archaeon]MBT6743990.1 hypothetical protein [Candidatus Woesearchaeota archaeon]
MKCTECKGENLRKEGKYTVCNDCGSSWEKGMKPKEQNYDSRRAVFLLAGDGICPKCKKKGLHHGMKDNKFTLLCTKCDYIKIKE